MATPEETFTDDQINQAIKQFLDYGEQTYVPHALAAHEAGHGGYFSGPGWAARCLRYHLQHREGNPLPSKGE